MKLTNKVGYSAVAAAVSLACGTAFGATISAPSATFSAEGNATAPAGSLYTAAVEVILGAEYAVGDTVSLAITNGEYQLGTATGATDTASVTCSGSSMVLGFLSRTATSANYRATTVDSAGQTGSTCSFNAPILRSSLTTTGEVVTIGWSAQTGFSGLALDPAAAAATVGSVVSQFSSPSSVTALNGIVDVNAGRYQFTSDDAGGAGLGGTEDTLLFTTQDNTGLNGAADLTSIVAVISGDFSFVDDNGTAGCQASDLTSGHGQISASTGSISINSACTELTFTDTAAGAAVLTLGANTATSASVASGSKVFTAPQSFTVAPLTYSYAGTGGGTTGSASVAFSSTGSAGAWTLNGASVDVDYMPFGTNISRIIYVTNRSLQSGAVSVSAFNEDGVACPAFDAGTSTAGTVTVLSGAINSGIEGCYGAGYDGKVAMTITVNVPAGGIEVYSAYNVSGNRVTVVNDSNVDSN